MTIEQMIEGLSEAEKAQILNTQFPEEMEKEAAAELASGDLAEVLFAYGAYTADKAVAETEELSKEASAEFETAEKEIGEALEGLLDEAGVFATEDSAELHKEAQAAAAIMHAGFVAQLEKLAEDPKKAGKIKEMAGKAYEGAKAHKGKIGAGIAAGALGGYMLKRHMDKKASELSVDEMSDEVLEKLAVSQVISEGLEKLAYKGEEAAKKTVELLKKHKAAIGAGAGGMVAGAAAHKYMGKKK